jgi:hypothetical protein
VCDPRWISTAVASAVGDDTQDLANADFDNDGRLDIVSVSSGDNRVAVHFGGLNSFNEASYTTTTIRCVGVY